MLAANEDILFKITEFLLDRSIIYLTMTCKKFDTLKYKFIYREKVCVEKISYLSYFDNFECVELKYLTDPRPKCARYVHFNTGETDIPNFVTHLMIDAAVPSTTHVTVPAGVTDFTLHGHDSATISPTVTYLNLMSNVKIDIPDSVTKLSIGGIHDICDFHYSIPSSVKYMKLYYGQGDASNYIPSSVKKLKLLTSSMIKTPSSVTHLSIMFGTNAVLDYSFIPSVTHLKITSYCNVTFLNSEHSHVTHLVNRIYLGSHHILKHLPPQLTHLTFGVGFDQPIVSALPDSLIHLTFEGPYQYSINDNMAPSLTCIRFGPDFESYDNLPSTVTHIEIGYGFDTILPNFPANVTHLTLGSYFNLPLKDLSLTITDLNLSERYYHPISDEITKRVNITRTRYRLPEC